MDNLRLWLLLAGGVFIAAVYGWGKFQERRAARQDGFERVGGVPGTGDDDAWDVVPLRAERHALPVEALDELAIPVLHDVITPAPAAQPEPLVPEPLVPAAAEPGKPQAPAPASAPDAAVQAAERELIVVLGVTAAHGREYAGADLASTFTKAGLYFGDMGIFHAPVDLERPQGPMLFSVANMVEPGTLEPEKLKLLTTPGLFLFTRLPGRVNGVETFDHLHATARFLVRELGGEVCDERRQPLTPEKTIEIRERIRTIIGEAVVVPED
ncbi:MAG: cell division protein ZipA C-terminal FtsZ-binding domain-containing protein [Thiohalomonadaceae bacterium]